MKENNQNKNKNTEPNRKLAAMGCITICVSALLTNTDWLDGILPDWAVRIAGCGLMLCTVVMIVLVVKSLAEYSKQKHENKENIEKDEQK